MRLYDVVTNNNDRARFHTPGHGGRNFDNKIYCHAKYDITELAFSDNLQAPAGAIAEAEARASEIYGVSRMLFFSSGATTAVFTALIVAAEFFKKVCVYGAAHKSFRNGCKLAGLDVFELGNDGDLSAIDGETAVFVTSPDYFGVVVSREELALLRQKARLLIIDSAHGAHYNFSPLLPDGHQTLGDLVVMSPHKTLPALTGGAVLAVNSVELAKKCVTVRADIHTTSPSYPVLASIDYALEYMSRKGVELYDKLFVAVERAKSLLMEHSFRFYENDDFTRLVLDLGADAEFYAKRLNERGIYPELCQDELLVFVVTPFNVKRLKPLIKELIRIKNNG